MEVQGQLDHLLNIYLPLGQELDREKGQIVLSVELAPQIRHLNAQLAESHIQPHLHVS